jgi:hypothetical protein
VSACVICSTKVLREIPMHDRHLLVLAARDMLQGMRTASGGFLEPPMKPPRFGICVVERCARLIEASCGGCLETTCQRCSIAAELRAAESRINAERDAEIAELGSDQLIGEIVNKIAENLCGTHAPFGPVLVDEWYGRKIFAVST